MVFAGKAWNKSEGAACSDALYLVDLRYSNLLLKLIRIAQSINL